MENSIHSTIDTSKDESIKKAISLLFEDNNVINIVHPKRRPIKEVMIGLLIIIIVLSFWLWIKLLFSKLSIYSSSASKVVDLIFLFLIFTVVTYKLKNVIIWLIRLYQFIAPKRIRNSCVFLPTCSEYAIMTLEKYGVLVGLRKTISRLKRCHYPNSGYDYP